MRMGTSGAVDNKEEQRARKILHQQNTNPWKAQIIKAHFGKESMNNPISIKEIKLSVKYATQGKPWSTVSVMNSIKHTIKK